MKRSLNKIPLFALAYFTTSIVRGVENQWGGDAPLNQAHYRRKTYHALSFLSDLLERILMEKAWNKIKQTWEENPILVIIVASAAMTAGAKLIDATTAARNARVWAKEVDRRVYSAPRGGRR